MKIEAITIVAVLAVQAAPKTGVPKERNISVCMEEIAEPTLTLRARQLASEMFAGIGVTIEWHRGSRGCPPQALQVTVSSDTPDELKPGALGYALPFEGTHIRIFYDRIVHGYSQTLAPILMAHVLVHEITHLVQGVCRHATDGVMKPNWDTGDLARMTRKPLEFTAEDVRLIYRGLATRRPVARASDLRPR